MDKIKNMSSHSIKKKEDIALYKRKNLYIYLLKILDKCIVCLLQRCVPSINQVKESACFSQRFVSNIKYSLVLTPKLSPTMRQFKRILNMISIYFVMVKL